MKPPKFWPIQKHERTPEIVAKDISPETFQTIWGSQFTDYENGLRKKIKAQEKRREIKQARIEHLQTLRNRGLTLQEIGDLVGITRERVRQLLAYVPAPRKLRAKRIKRRDERFYSIWKKMVWRATKKKPDPHYKGNGIGVSDSWLTYANFEKDMWPSYVKHVRKFGEFKTTLDRTNNEKGYRKTNCRWATPSVQGKNRRPFDEWTPGWSEQHKIHVPLTEM